MADKTLVQKLREHAHEMTAYGMDPTAALLAKAAAEIERLRKTGPEMQRGTTGDGKPWMGTMLDVLNDNAQAASVEAGFRREYAAEIERLAGDAERMAWLERQSVNVRTPLRYGSRANFWCTPDTEETTSDLRARVDAALKAEARGDSKGGE